MLYITGDFMEKVNHPSHYNVGRIEVIDYLKDQGVAEDFCIGNVIKYISRYKHKNDPLEDLKKARWYLNWVISNIDPSNKNKGGNCE